ncbi:hypothetical protein PISL3812_04876 [Talaromyces islandicus]|uniref:Carbohydrate esterase family 16 protein n=1 Tax=Talaromyces islandicus TaxID=28573 RepID=A0A0U1LX55_TALIS|nr:hypothetical protein PISL3812_04876 [Talaromyces islandicus]
MSYRSAVSYTALAVFVASILLWIRNYSLPALSISKPAQSRMYWFAFGDSYSATGFDVSSTQPSASNPMGNTSPGLGTQSGGTIAGATIDNSLATWGFGDMTSQLATFQSNYASRPESAPWTVENAMASFWIGINDPQVYEENHLPESDLPEKLQRHAAMLTAYNDGLKNMVHQFSNDHKDATIVLYDSWSFMTRVLDNPTAYGYKDAMCMNTDGSSCLWWNNLHPGWTYHKNQADDMLASLAPLGW